MNVAGLDAGAERGGVRSTRAQRALTPGVPDVRGDGR